MIDTLYKEEILEHYKSPLNFGSLKKYNVSSRQLNPFCGDEIEIFIKFGPLARFASRRASSGEKKIREVSFTGVGCAISIASASLLTEYIKGKNKKTLQKFTEKDMMKLLDIEVSETRKKCALLAWAVMKDCL